MKVFLDGKSPNLYKPPQSHGSLMNLISISSGSHSISSKIGGFSSGERFSPLDKAIPNDIKIKKIVAYINKNVVFSTNTGSSIS